MARESLDIRMREMYAESSLRIGAKVQSVKMKHREIERERERGRAA